MDNIIKFEIPDRRKSDVGEDVTGPKCAVIPLHVPLRGADGGSMEEAEANAIIQELLSLKIRGELGETRATVLLTKLGKTRAEFEALSGEADPLSSILGDVRADANGVLEGWIKVDLHDALGFDPDSQKAVGPPEFRLRPDTNLDALLDKYGSAEALEAALAEAKAKWQERDGQ